MKNKGNMNNISDQELIQLFNQANSIDEKLQIFSKIQDDNCKIELLNSIPEDATIPTNMLSFKLDNIDVLNLDFLINIQKHVNNYSKMKFKINEHKSASVLEIEYSFSEILAIIAKIEELTTDIPRDMDEANKFYKIYSRVTGGITYDYECVRKSNDLKNKLKQSIEKKEYSKADRYCSKLKEIRKKPAGLYGGLIEGKAICAGYALILHELQKYVGLKSQYVLGLIPGQDGHAWNQVRINRKWYNVDPTWDSQEIQFNKIYKNMLLNDEDFNKNHEIFSNIVTKTKHKCKSRFDYSKIQGLLSSQIESTVRRENEL